MSGTVKIDSATAESAISGLTIAQDEISQCDGTGPEQVDAGAVTDQGQSQMLYWPHCKKYWEVLMS